VRLARHTFRFGCNGFGLRTIKDRELLRGYEEQFVALLNAATLPFYWGMYEPHPGETREEHLREMAQWCCGHGLATKGHPLVWHEVFPEWAERLGDAEARRRLRERVTTLVSSFRGLVDTWDVVNEATVSARFDNVVGRWIKEEGAAAMVGEMLRLARDANPDAELLYNDFNLRSPDFLAGPFIPDCEALIRALLDAGAPLDAIGLHSHMHARTWSLAEAWGVCEHYGRIGLPLHFTELTVLSGRPKDPNDRDWHRVHTDWPSTPEGEEAQAEFGEALYTVLYSHPAVAAITWWDFSDYAAWQGAPAGLARADMSPKPLYERLLRLVWGDWATHYDGILTKEKAAPGGSGLTVRCAAGRHTIALALASGDALAGTFVVPPGQTGPVPVVLA
jgi:GH35 family endo-1,4-beta-xylanase